MSLLSAGERERRERAGKFKEREAAVGKNNDERSAPLSGKLW